MLILATSIMASCNLKPDTKTINEGLEQVGMSLNDNPESVTSSYGLKNNIKYYRYIAKVSEKDVKSIKGNIKSRSCFINDHVMINDLEDFLLIIEKTEPKETACLANSGYIYEKYSAEGGTIQVYLDTTANELYFKGSEGVF